MGNGDFGWVGKIKSIPTNFGHRTEDKVEAEEIVNNMLKDGWKLLAIVNDVKLVIARGDSDLPATESYYILGRSGS